MRLAAGGMEEQMPGLSGTGRRHWRRANEGEEGAETGGPS
jgi:hypothetical protein